MYCFPFQTGEEQSWSTIQSLEIKDGDILSSDVLNYENETQIETNMPSTSSATSVIATIPRDIPAVQNVSLKTTNSQICVISKEHFSVKSLLFQIIDISSIHDINAMYIINLILAL